MYFFNSFLSLTQKGTVLLVSKYLTYPIIWRNFVYMGLITLSSLYPIKYLNEPLLMLYDTFLEINILSTSMSSILNSFLFL